MAFDGSAGGGDPHASWCRSCRRLFLPGEEPTHVRFAHDPHGHEGYTGLYHATCARLFASLSRAMDALGRRSG
jgi:hypothetical protein